MSADKKDADGAGTPDESGAPRRKRRTGLRVPSDNVPRPDRATGPFAAMTAETPEGTDELAAEPVPGVVTIMPAGARGAAPATLPPPQVAPAHRQASTTIPSPVGGGDDLEVDVEVVHNTDDGDDDGGAAPSVAAEPDVGSAAALAAVAAAEDDHEEFHGEPTIEGAPTLPVERAASSPIAVEQVAAAAAPVEAAPVDVPPPAAAPSEAAPTPVVAPEDATVKVAGPPAAMPRAAAESAAASTPAQAAPPRAGTIGDYEELSPGEYEEVDSGPVAAPAAAAAAPSGDLAVSPSQPVRTVPPPPPAAPQAKPTPPPAPRAAAAAAAAAASGAATAKAKAAKSRKGKAWYEEVFDEDYLRTLPFLTPQATQREAGFIAEALQLQAGQQVLDLGCGYGRHAMELAARGFHVVGLDLSLPLLIRGADEAQRRGLNINFVHGDMRELTFDGQFDGAYCVFSTFGYFDDETNKRVASNLARALKTGGRLVIEVVNRDYVITDLPTRVWWEGDGCVVLEEVDFNYFTSRVISNRSVVFEDGRQLEQEISLRAYSLHELGKLLHAAGFRVLEVSGGLATRGRFFGGESRQIIIVAQKRGDAPGGTLPPPLK